MNAQLEPQARHGIISGLSNAEYHADKTSYSSSLIKLLDCPAKAKHYMDNGSEYKDAYRLGTAIHTLVLEPEKFDSEFLTGIDCARRSKDDKAEWAAFYKEHGFCGAYDWVINNPASTWNGQFSKETGKHIVSNDEISDLHEIRDAVYANPDALELLEKGAAEQSIYAQDPETGLRLRVRPDFLSEAGFISDLKSIPDVDDWSIDKAIANYGYDLSQAMYQHVTQLATGEWLPYCFIFVSKSKPAMCRVIALSEESAQKGWEKYQANKAKLAECLSTGEWSGWPNDLNRTLFQRKAS